MRGSYRPFWLVFGGVLLVLMVAGVAAAVSVHRAGMLEVDIHCAESGGPDIVGLKIPGALVLAVMGLMPDETFHAASQDLRRWGPLVREACHQIGDAPDFVLVRVDSPDERVCVEKRGRNLIVDVQGDGEDVHVVVPLSTVGAILKKVGRA